MMYKKTSILCLCFLFLLLLPHKAYGEQIELQDADILLIYANRISMVDTKNIETIVSILTYQNFSVAYGSVEECKGSLSKYGHIICYDLGQQDDILIRELVNVDSSIMMMGKDIIEAYITQRDLNIKATEVEGLVARFTYNFSEQLEFSSLVDVTNSYYLEGDITYKNGTYELSGREHGFCIGNDKLRYLPTIDLENSLVKSVITNELARWMWPYNGEPYTYAQYIVFDKVYPFIDLDQIMDVIDVMIELKTPFVISVMPIYQNGEYPSMKRFCEVLTYAQSNGGAIVLHAPIIQTTNLDVEEIQEYLTTATEAFTNYGVYPIGIEAPSKWLFNEQGQEILKRYRTLLIYEEDNDSTDFDLKGHFNYIYKDGHQIISPAISLDESGSSQVKSYSAAIYMDILEDVDELKSRIHAYKNSTVLLKSFWEFSHVVYTNSSVLQYKNNMLTLNEEQVSLNFTPSDYEENYEYKRDIINRITVDLENQNKKLILAVSIAIVLFIMFIIIARNANKKKFFYPKEK